MIVDGINLIDGVISNAAVESGTTLPVTKLDIGRLFFLTQLDGANSPGLYIYNGTEWESSGETGDIESVIASTGLLGGGNSGDVTLEVDTTYVATKTITDNLEANKVNKSGDTMTGNLNMGTNVIGSLGDPVSATDAANKQYVDGEISAIDFTPYVEKSGSSLTGDLIFAAASGIRFGDLAQHTEIRDNVIEGVPSLQVDADGVAVADVFSSGMSLRSGKTMTLAQDPTLNLHAATKQYVDSEISAIDYSAFLQKSGGTMTGALILDADPTLNLGAATKQYVDNEISSLDGTLDGNKVSKSGDTMTGFLTLSADPTLALHAATKQYVDTEISNIDFTPYLEKAGGTVTGALTVNGTLTTEAVDMRLGEGLVFSEVANYFGTGNDARLMRLRDTDGSNGAVDGGLIIEGFTSGDGISEELLRIRTNEFEWKGNTIWHAGNDGAASGLDADLLDGVQGSVYARRDQANTFTNFVTLHADPVNATHAATKQYVDNAITGLDFKQSVRVATTTNITLSGLQTIDGLAVTAGMRVLVKNQTNAAENGIYDVASGAWTRSEDADGTPANEVTTGMYVFVEGGSTQISSGWVLSTVGTINLDTTPLTFTQFTGLGQIEAGNGLQKSGNTISIGSGSGIQVDVNGVSLFNSDPRNANHDNIAINAGAGLTGGGNISSSRTLNVGEGTGINVTADAINLDTTYTDTLYQKLNTYITATNSITAVAGQVVFADTTVSGQFTVNLPGSPSLGDEVTIIDVKSNFGTAKVVVGRNGNTIMGLTENMDITTDNASVTLIYSGSAATGWRIKY